MRKFRTIITFVYGNFLISQDSLTVAFINDALQEYFNGAETYYLRDTGFAFPLGDSIRRSEILSNCKKFIPEHEVKNMLSKGSQDVCWISKKIKNAITIGSSNTRNPDTALLPGKLLLYVCSPIFDSKKKYALFYIYDSSIGAMGGGSCFHLYHFENKRWIEKDRWDCVDF